ncbi:hypothetical protein [Streptosporangium canum]
MRLRPGRTLPDAALGVFGVIDDRASVATMWRSLGLTVVQVTEGLF